VKRIEKRGMEEEEERERKGREEKESVKITGSAETNNGGVVEADQRELVWSRR
jgi:hypothetical protein